MKVLMLNGSPKANGNTATALKEMETVFLQEGIEVETVQVGNQAVRGCIACGGCRRQDGCVFDDVVNDFLDTAKYVDGFVFGTPVHYAAASGALTSFMDRVFYSGKQGGTNPFYLKPASAIVSARRGGTTAAFDQLNKYLTISEMPVISSRYWNMVHGNTPEQVMQDEEGMQCMRILGRNMAWFLKCKEAGALAGIPLPEKEKITPTNFIR